MQDWTKKTVSFEFLREQASKSSKPIDMVGWLRLIGVIPLTTEWRRGNRHPNTNLNANAISAGYLAEVAHDWNQEGRTTPTEFVDSLTFEIEGHKNKLAVVEALSGVHNGG